MLFINHELTPGAMVRAVMTATEAKTAALQELLVPSRYSDSIATGTGTDQIAIASRLGTGIPLSSAGKHTKLGELIGKVVLQAVKGALALQNRLTPGSRCTSLAMLERLGLDRDSLCEGISRYLSDGEAGLLCENIDTISSDPVTVAAVAAIVHLRDMIRWGILPEGCIPEILGSYAAQITAAVSGRYHRIQHYREGLAGLGGIEREEFVSLICRAIAMGFKERWEMAL